MANVQNVLKEHIVRHNMKFTKQRSKILETFLKMDRHVTAEDLFKKVSRKESNIGLATVYRTLNLFCQSGLAQPRNFGDGQTRYELTYNTKHHDHLVCTKCGKIIEFENLDIEKHQREVADKHRFKVFNHKLELYGNCSDCA